MTSYGRKMLKAALDEAVKFNPEVLPKPKAHKSPECENWLVQSLNNQCDVGQFEDVVPGASTTDQLPLQSKASTADQLPLQSTASTSDQLPLQSTASTSDQLPLQSTASTSDQLPLQSTASTADQLPLQSTASTADQLPLQSTALTADQLPPQQLYDDISIINDSIYTGQEFSDISISELQQMSNYVLIDLSCQAELNPSCAAASVQGSFHQGEEIFDELSRGRQCMCNSLMSLCSLPSLSICSTVDIDEILLSGDDLYHFIKSKSPNHDFLEVADLPQCIHFLGVGHTVHFINHGYHGLCGSRVELSKEDTVLNLPDAIEECFKITSTGLIIIGSYAIGMFRNVDGTYGIFDSHSRNSTGSISTDGKSIVTYFSSFYYVKTKVLTLCSELNLSGKQFHVQPVKIIKINETAPITSTPTFQETEVIVEDEESDKENHGVEPSMVFNPPQMAAINKSSRKRKVSAELRLSGKEYVGFKRIRNGKVEHTQTRLPKSVKDRCTHSALVSKSTRTNLCATVSDETRQNIFQKFWSLQTWEAKKAMVGSFVATRTSAIKRRDMDTTEKSTKEYMRDCYLSTASGKVKVCREFFINTLNIGEDQFKRWTKEHQESHPNDDDTYKSVTSQPSHSNGDVTSPCAAENQINKCKSKKNGKESVETWLQLLPKVPSHYCRSSTSKVYIESTFRSILHMHEVYKKWAETSAIPPAGRTLFTDILKQSHISIHAPRKDQCDICFAHDAGNIEEEIYQRHKDKKDKCREAKNKAKRDASDTHYVLTVDLQSVLLAPSLQASAVYYKQKLQVHNFTIYRLNDGDVSLYVWDETNGGVTANEFVSCIIDYLSGLPESVKKVTIVSDGCGYQNRNRVLSNALNVFSLNKNISVEQLFLEKGHTMMECDSVHSTLEQLFKCPAVYAPSDYVFLMRQARPKQFYTVKAIDYTFFKNYECSSQSYTSIRPGRRAGDPVVADIRHLRYENGTIHYKFISTDDWQEMPQKRQSSIDQTKICTNPAIPQLYESRLKISTDKYKHLQELKSLIPSEYHNFYDSLPR